MIVFTLACGADHRFEAWFKDSAAYETQATTGAIACPFCNDTAIRKAPMAPNLATSGGDKSNSSEQRAEEVAREILSEIREQVEANCDNVGDRFAEEARRIHYGETKQRGIYGEATSDESRELAEEGVEFHKLPWLQRRN
jgi:hypothetical protein